MRAVVESEPPSRRVSTGRVGRTQESNRPWRRVPDGFLPLRSPPPPDRSPTQDVVVDAVNHRRTTLLVAFGGDGLFKVLATNDLFNFVQLFTCIAVLRCALDDLVGKATTSRRGHQGMRYGEALPLRRIVCVRVQRYQPHAPFSGRA